MEGGTDQRRRYENEKNDLRPRRRVESSPTSRRSRQGRQRKEEETRKEKGKNLLSIALTTPFVL